jgi:hypothetical protein
VAQRSLCCRKGESGGGKKRWSQGAEAVPSTSVSSPSGASRSPGLGRSCRRSSRRQRGPGCGWRCAPSDRGRWRHRRAWRSDRGARGRRRVPSQTRNRSGSAGPAQPRNAGPARPSGPGTGASSRRAWMRSERNAGGAPEARDFRTAGCRHWPSLFGTDSRPPGQPPRGALLRLRCGGAFASRVLRDRRNAGREGRRIQALVGLVPSD